MQAELKSGNNVLYWRTTGYAMQGSAVKPVLLRNIGISGKLLPVSCAHQFKSFPLNYMLIGGFFSGVDYTSECFHCKPGTYSENPGSARCSSCPPDMYSNKGATVCLKCDKDKYSGMTIYILKTTHTLSLHDIIIILIIAI